jgi:hypothetical protein
MNVSASDNPRGVSDRLDQWLPSVLLAGRLVFQIAVDPLGRNFRC